MFKPTVVRHVSMPNLKLTPGLPVYVKVTDAIYEGKDRKDDPNERPPKILNVVNLATGEHMTLVAGAVVVSELVDNYEGDTYVGKTFEIEKGSKKEGAGGRGYFTYSITEIAEPTGKELDEFQKWYSSIEAEFAKANKPAKKASK